MVERIGATLRAYARSALYLLILLVLKMPSITCRRWCLKSVGARVGKKVVVHGGGECRAPWRLCLGDGSIIGDHSILDARGGIEIGRNVNISSQVAIWTAQHDYRSPTFSAKIAPVKVEDRAWLSFRCTILPGVTIGEGAVVAAGAVVTKNVAPFTVVAGIPARKIGERPREMLYELGQVAMRDRTFFL